MFLNGSSQRTKLALFLFGCLIFVGLCVRLVVHGWTTPPPDVFAQAEGLRIATSTEQVLLFGGAHIALPTKILADSELLFGVYTQETPVLPRWSVVAVFSKDNQRQAELIVKPGRTLENELGTSTNITKTPVKIGDIDGYLVNRSLPSSPCFKPIPDHMGMCQIRRSVLFEKYNSLYILGSDGNALSDGELLEAARSIP